MSNDPQAPSEAGVIGSQREFSAALLQAMAAAMQRRCRAMWCFDAAFDAWPLDDATLLEALTQWLRLPQRQWVLAARHFGSFAADHPRFMGWYRDWSHAVSARTPSEPPALEMPCLFMADSGEFVELFEPLRWRGRSGCDLRQVRQWRQQYDTLLQRCEAALPATILGL